MNRKPAEVELHLKGKRYKRALEKCERSIMLSYHATYCMRYGRMVYVYICFM